MRDKESGSSGAGVQGQSVNHGTRNVHPTMAPKSISLGIKPAGSMVPPAPAVDHMNSTLDGGQFRGTGHGGGTSETY